MPWCAQGDHFPVDLCPEWTTSGVIKPNGTEGYGQHEIDQTTDVLDMAVDGIVLYIAWESFCRPTSLATGLTVGDI